MKKFKKLIPALCMLLISAVLMGTSTYAWFSMNKTVTAEGMQVTANSDSAYLIISAGESLTGSSKTATAGVNASLKPVSPKETLTSANIETAGSWGTATSDNPDDANVAATLTALTGAFLGDGKYVYKQSFMVGIVENSGAVNDDLRLASVKLTEKAGMDGLTVVIVCGANIYTYDATNENITTKQVLAASNLVDKNGVEVKVYIFIDGKNEAVKSANATQLGGSVELTFTIEPFVGA